MWPYYWYGYYPYYWYRPYPYGYWIGPGVSNYYYYNYQTPTAESDSGYEVQEPDYEAFRRARERLEKQEQETAEQSRTQTDVDFDEGIKAFEQGDYGVAAAKFARAAKSTPEDIVLPFAYSQALLAGKEYQKAAEVLRDAIGRLKLKEEGVFYPRGLYASDTELEKQILELEVAAKGSPTDYDLQLLAGYQHLGMNRLDVARKYLEAAKNDVVNGPAARSLLSLLAKLEAEAVE